MNRNVFDIELSDDPIGDIDFTQRDAIIKDKDGNIVFEQKDVIFPDFFSQDAVNIVSSKYFKVINGVRENSFERLVHRVVISIVDYGLKLKYYDSNYKMKFYHNLKYLILNQFMSFNSPVWFNVGIDDQPQCSACFILSVEDNMESILEWYKTEGKIFKGGSGSGINLSNLRGSKEHLSGGGISSGPVSFMRGADSIAGAIKSGGKTRRAAKMVVLNVDHPDIREFISCKHEEEKKAYALGSYGYDMSLNGEAWKSIQYQNANNSVRVSNSFMTKAIEDKKFDLVNRTNKEETTSDNAKEILRLIAECAHSCGDPGVQFDTTINAWNTIPERRINASNPCSEYMHMDDSACNLASINLCKFIGDNGKFDLERFCDAVKVTILAQDILVSLSSYPTETIKNNANRYRQLGIGFCNLGALLIELGLPYGSKDAQYLASTISHAMTISGYKASSEIADVVGTNLSMKEKESCMSVIDSHNNCLAILNSNKDDKVFKLINYFNTVRCGELPKNIRNSQISVIAPTGTISFMMDADTTGIEPLLALQTHKNLVGGGSIVKTYKCVSNYISKKIKSNNEFDIIEYMKLNEKTDEVLATAIGNNKISYASHIDMMASVQPFISGAISKTVNMPEESTVEDIEKAIIYAWRCGLKSIAIYRDGSKKVQPMSSSKKEVNNKTDIATNASVSRRKLPDTRKSITHKFNIAGNTGFITLGLFNDGSPGEIFVNISKDGSTISGLMDAFATMTSLALQYGVPIEKLHKKFINTKFEPSGITSNKDIRFASSIIDYIFKWVNSTIENKANFDYATEDILRVMKSDLSSMQTIKSLTEEIHAIGEVCTICGSLMVINGGCLMCTNCGATTGCTG